MAGRAHHSLRIFTFVAQAEVLMVWLLFALAFWLPIYAYRPGYLEVVAAAGGLLLAVPFLQYGFVIVEYTARGHNEIPRMASGILATDARIYRLGAVALLLLATLGFVPVQLQLAATALVLMVTPAVTSFLAFYNSIASSLNPVRIYHFISNMGFTYVALRLVGNSVMLIVLYFFTRGIELYRTPIGALMMSLTVTYLVLTMFRGTGVLLHMRHAQLGIDTDFSKEKAEQAFERKKHAAHRKLVLQLAKLCGSNRADRARERLDSFLADYEYADKALLLKYLREQGVDLPVD